MQLTIGKKLYLFAAIALLMLIALTTINLFGGRQANADMQNMVEHEVKTLLLTQAIDRDLLEIRFRVAGVVLDQLPSVGAQNHLKQARQAIESNWQAFAAIFVSHSTEESELAAQIAAGIKALPPIFSTVDALYGTNDNEALKMVLEDDWPIVITKVQKPLAQLVKLREDSLAQLQEQSLQDGQRRTTLTLGISVLAAVLLLAIATFIIRSITRPLASLQDTIVQVERSGDCTLRVGIQAQDEIGHTAAAFDGMLARIAALIGETRGSATAIAAAAQEMSAAGVQVARGSGEQSAAASAVAAAIEQTSVSMSETAHNAQLADETATRARNNIETTLATVRDAADNVDNLAAMISEASGDIARLAESSRQIDGIVRTIKDIADQTNLLALNAAIEAARAGEQGRGFAVVADEVRKLAENTAHATNEISGLISGVQSQVDAAVYRMQAANEKAGTARERVVASTDTLDSANAETHRVTESVRNIADAMREQDSAVQQVSQRIEQIAQMTEENTAAADAAARTAQHLDELADGLRQSVAKFKV